MAIEIVDFPMKNEVIFQFAMLNYQRLNMARLSSYTYAYVPAYWEHFLVPQKLEQ